MDIRLVFAPEKEIGFFGEDADNFSYPRWNLDIAFLGVHENGKPLQPIHYLSWSPKGARNGELTLDAGHPGSARRLLTMAELELQRDVVLQPNLDRHKNSIAALKRYSAEGPEQSRVARKEKFRSENSFKALNEWSATEGVSRSWIG